MKILSKCLIIGICTLMLSACVHKIVTVPVKVAYKTTKAVVKGTVAVSKAIIPDGDKQKDKQKEQQNAP